MNEVSQNSENKGKDRDEKGRFLKGHGIYKPLGSKHLSTKIRDALTTLNYKNEKGEEIRADVAFVKKLLDTSIIKGDIQAMKLVLNYIDGLPSQDIELNGNLNVNYIDVLKAIKEKEDKYDNVINTETNKKDKK